MDYRIGFAALFFLAVPAWAAEKPVMTVEQLCRRLVTHRPDDDVAYDPGKDVYGRKVAPATIDGENGQIELNDTVNVGIGVYQAQQLNLPANTPFSPELYLGNAEIHKDGGVSFNGKRLSQPQVQTLCDPKFRQMPQNDQKLK